MTMHALLADEPIVDETRVRDVLSSNLCRTGYDPIVNAVLEARSASTFTAPEDVTKSAEAREPAAAAR